MARLCNLCHLCQVFYQLLLMASNYWIAWGSEREDSVTKEQLVGIFALHSGGSSLFILARAILLSTIAIATAQCLFLGMMSSVFRAPLSFFDSTPSSRILNRSSADQSVVDTDIPYSLVGLVFALNQLLSIIVLMSQVAWQVFFLFLAIFIIISIWYQAYYIKTAGELARLVPSASSDSSLLFEIDSWSYSNTQLQSGRPVLEKSFESHRRLLSRLEEIAGKRNCGFEAQE